MNADQFLKGYETGDYSQVSNSEPPKTYDVKNESGRTSDYLKVDDIVNDQGMLDSVRSYMIDRKGKQYVDADPEEMVDEWMEHMRWFNTNEVYTIGEVNYMTRADEDKRARAGEAYKIYDELGGFWHNDGLSGAVDGLWDYTKAIFWSPSTWAGAGVGKGLTMLGGKTTTAMLRKQARNALSKKAMGDTTSKKVVSEAFKDAAFKDVKNKARKTALITGAVDGAIVLPQDYFLQKTEMKAGSRNEYNPWQTVLSASLIGAGTATGMRFIPKAQKAIGREYDPLQGQIRQLKKLSKDRFSITSGTKKEAFDKAAEEINKTFKKLLDKTKKEYADLKIVEKKPKKDYTDFRKGAIEGEKFQKDQNLIAEVKNSGVWTPELEASIIKKQQMSRLDIDPDTGQVIVKRGDKEVNIFSNVFDDSFLTELFETLDTINYANLGIKFREGINDGEKLAVLLENLPSEKLKELSEATYVKTGIHLGDVADQIGFNLGNQIRYTGSKGGKIVQRFNMENYGKKEQMMNESLVVGMLNQGMDAKEADEILAKLGQGANKPEKKAQYGRWLQGVWKRMIVSTPQTTAINVYGFTQMYGAKMVAEMFQGGMLAALAKMQQYGGNNLAAQRSMHQAKALFAVQTTKLKNLADPYATRELYMELLNANPDLKKKLFETTAGGVEATADKFDIDRTGKGFIRTEAITTLAQNLSGVQLQDHLTKSQAFVSNLDKHLRIKEGISLEEALQRGDVSAIDSDVMSLAGRDTLESVFSAEWGTRARIGDADAGNYLFGRVGKGIVQADDTVGNIARGFADFVETASRNPVIGYYLPFGRFMNNVVATSYHWSPLAFLPAAASIAKGNQLKASEALSKAIVGTTAITTMMSVDKQKQEKGQAWNEVQMGDGTIIDATNTFPASLVLVGARVMNRFNEGGMGNISPELKADFGRQIAIGQLTRDLDFGKDVSKILGSLNLFGTNFDVEQGSRSPGMSKIVDATRETEYSPIGKGIDLLGVGGIISGFTRPLDPLNKIIGMATGTDDREDIRAEKSGTVRVYKQLTRYTDNIFENLIGRVGEPAQSATVEGDVRDPAPAVTMMGFKTKAPTTYASMVFGQVDLPDWKASMYTGIPEHDSFVNKVITPILERKSQILLKNKKFINGTSTEKRKYAEAMLRSAKANINMTLDAEYDSSDAAINRRKMKLDNRSTLLLRQAREITGIKVPVREMSNEELSQMENTIYTIQQTDKEDVPYN